jgi:hypothetical protein
MSEVGRLPPGLEWLANPDTVLGKLQRGTGDGFLKAVALPTGEAADLVWDCVVHDARWDQQMESRDRYYADLIARLDFDPHRLRPQNCPEPPADRDHRLVVGVLAELAADGMTGAGEALLDHVRSGEQWDDAIYEISQTPGDLHRRLPDVLEGSFEGDELVAIVQRWRYELPWEELGAGRAWVQSAIDRFDERPRRSAVSAELPSMDLSAAELLQHDWPGVPPKRLLHRLTDMLRRDEREELLAALEREGSGRFVAFQALARLDNPGGLPAAERILAADESGRKRLEATRYVSNLAPVHTLALARSWLRADDGRRVAARNVLAKHAEYRDVPMLRAHAEAAWAERHFYGLCSYIDALARLPDDIPVRLITEIFHQGEYSYARCRAARVLAVASGGRLPTDLARPALYDCETEIQDLGLAAGLADRSDADLDRASTLRSRRRPSKPTRSLGP